MHYKYLYEVEHPEGTTEKLADNIIAENMMSQVDSEGHHYKVLTEVTDNKKNDSSISNVDCFINSSSGNIHRKRTTLVWKLLVEFKEVSVDWVPLKDLKHSNPVELDQYAAANEMSYEPAFNWWVKENL